ncbi:hypothetical protein [Stigmatella aurantiaca]|uniref:Conserved uncharacterized protein n=1 Tax=Stigmatella aurantiaca (strain DW4/3-1) TaxID=378806 RepID=Q08VA4_STIAD|nr:hypothetical protein [Stigmatella aurantiaca]ADO73296.1 conserved uncharacterized protein [Stigmatella aurantiaca DW4/3-1]EAU64416.1 hypothetical protein STIAU_5490 [Stigmatella aurantiaca DW4/3-1]
MTRRLRLSFLTLSALLALSAACDAPTHVESQKVHGAPNALPSEVERVIQSIHTEVSSPISVNPSPASDETQQRPAVAQGPGVYLVVWEVSSSATGASPDIVGVRVRASDGALLDPSPLLIATGPNSQTEPAVAFDGTHFLVVWVEDRGLPAIYGRRVSASDGALIDSTAVLISKAMSPGQSRHATPSVACGGPNCMVTWSDSFNASQGGPLLNFVVATLLRASDGTPLENYTFVPTTTASTPPRITFGSPHYLVSWVENSKLRATLYDARTLGQRTVTVTSSADPQAPSVAGQGGEFLLTWLEAGSVWARRVSASTGALLGSANTLVGTGALAQPSVTADGVDYHVLGTYLRNGSARVISTRVSALAEIAPNAEIDMGPALPHRGDLAAPVSGLYLAAYVTEEATGAPRVNVRRVTEGKVHITPERLVKPLDITDVPHYMPTVSAGNGVSLVVWSHPVSGGGFVLRGLRVRASDGQVLDSAPLTIDAIGSPNYYPAVAFDGTHFLVVWVRYASVPSIYGARVRASDGAVLDSPFHISVVPAGGPVSMQDKPAVAFDGTNYLVTWEGPYGDASNGAMISGVQGIRVAPYGMRLDSSSFLIAQGGSNSRVAYSDGNYLVTWDRNQNVEAARISASTRQVLDNPAISLAASSGNERLPAVAGQGGKFLVTWIGGDNNLWARRVSGLDGSLLDSGDISVGPTPLTGPEAIFDGRDYWIGWQGTRNGLRQMFSTRVSALGTLRNDAELSISYVHPSTGQGSSLPQARGGIAAAGPGLLLSAYLQYDSLTGYSAPRFRLVSAEPGQPALPLVREAHAVWAGCDYALVVRQDMVNDPYPKTLYRLFAELSADDSTCTAAGTSVALGESEYVPVLDIKAGAAGIAVGYSQAFTYKGIGTLSHGYVAQLDPNTLGIVRRFRLQPSSLPTSCEAGGPGRLEVGQITLTNGSDLVVEGPISGNHIALWTSGGGVDFTTPCDGSSPRSTTFTLTLPGFFTQPQTPSIVIH